jgi:hypothetical protein
VLGLLIDTGARWPNRKRLDMAAQKVSDRTTCAFLRSHSRD